MAFEPLYLGGEAKRCRSTPKRGEVLIDLAPGRYLASVERMAIGTIEVPASGAVHSLSDLLIERAKGDPILCVLPVSTRDLAQAIDLLDWIFELGGQPENDALVVADCKIDEEDVEMVLGRAKIAFAKATVIRTPHSLPDERWPLGPNWMFETAVRWVAEHWRKPFWWNEADCIPLVTRWLTTLENAYYAALHPFMGYIVDATNGSSPAPRHLTGCAVYPGNAMEYMRHTFGSIYAWDVASHSQVVPITHHTLLFQHNWGTMGKPPTYLTLDPIRPGAVVAHRCKDGSLTRLLRARRNA